ncbi:MAG: DUF6391 domain-containing protein [Anaerolineaceae bacterium]|nr:DUF6391 domain-containing protein [Anaerolineaceae bacterium]
MTKPFLDTLPIISQVRRNHSLEHATMHLLAQRFKGLSMTGVSGVRGFYLLADLPTETICEVSLEALKRLNAGEKELALHDNCGTNLAVPSILAGIAIWAAMLGTDKDGNQKWRRLPFALIFAVPVFLFSRPLGAVAQKYLTTSENPGSLTIKLVTTQKYSGRSLHHIFTHD